MTATKTMLLPCPVCAEPRATVTLNLGDLNTCQCLECDNEFTLEAIHDILTHWPAVLAWIDQAPIAEDRR